eukprot:CAMPEP_0118966964 /NCGR_PEP_ID=MMETSP1173-20130426/4402_1 /TAXON_ID=1034831 /ORGANISM="Rhizochromulina marina cf, Strain CCMP1243" /LENGTH=560 /DNA_ID=CAMNT_0006915847 /DNA_START=32 /DNA_END=1714 /DNA_ORIENTATION=+
MDEGVEEVVRRDDTTSALESRARGLSAVSVDLDRPLLAADQPPGVAPVVGNVTDFGTAVSLVKCAIGAGSLALPWAFQQGGLWFSFCFTCVLGVISTYTVGLLITCERKVLRQIHDRRQSEESTVSARRSTELRVPAPHRYLAQKHANRQQLMYPEVALHAFPDTTFLWRGRTPINGAQIIVDVGIVLTAVGVCAAYLDFLAATLPDVLGSWCNQAYATLLVTPLLIGLVLLRSFRYLSFTAALGDFSVSAALIAVIAYGFANTKDYGYVDFGLRAANPVGFGRFFGSVSLLFNIQIVVLPVAHAMEKPESFHRVNRSSYVFITLVNALFGFLCYGLFGNDVANPVTGVFGDNLSEVAAATLDAVKILLCVDLLFTFPFLFAAGREIVERVVINALFGVMDGVEHPHRRSSGFHLSGEKSLADKEVPIFSEDGLGEDAGAVQGAAAELEHRSQSPSTPPQSQRRAIEMTRNITRFAILGVIVGITFGVPCFGDMVNIVGGVVNSIMGFVLPCAIALRVLANELSPTMKAVNVAIIIFGLAACGVSLTYTIIDMTDPDHEC